MAVVLALSAGAAASAPQSGLTIQSASLTQQGQDLVWYVQLGQSFSPAVLEREHESLCLLIERPFSGRVGATLCVAPGRHRRPPPQLVLGGRTIAATIERPSSESLRASFLPASIGLRYAWLRWQAQTSVSASVCAEACTTVFPEPPKLLKLHTPKLVGCTAAGPEWVFHGARTRRVIALTFDDGPWYDTPQFLDLLEREHVVATFFEIGDQIAQYGQGGAIERRMLRDGDMIGDHTWNYGGNVAAGGEDAVIQIREAAAAIRRATGGFQPCLFRAPGGNVTPALLRTARSLGFTTIQWDVDPRDWALPGVGEIESNVIDNAHSGAIVIMHDGGGNRSETLAALPRIIGALRRRGYDFVTVTQLLRSHLRYK
jgi:peptidoglycan/xylan/chitin deacetylase (PgdA/CDA1 family)